MAELSPAAQAVRAAVRQICPAPADEIAAVALRAAADRTMNLIGDVCHPKYMEGIEAASDFLERIAAELEAL
jgi:hypothetical protein